MIMSARLVRLVIFASVGWLASASTSDGPSAWRRHPRLSVMTTRGGWRRGDNNGVTTADDDEEGKKRWWSGGLKLPRIQVRKKPQLTMDSYSHAQSVAPSHQMLHRGQPFNAWQSPVSYLPALICIQTK